MARAGEREREEVAAQRKGKGASPESKKFPRGHEVFPGADEGVGGGHEDMESWCWGVWVGPRGHCHRRGARMMPQGFRGGPFLKKCGFARQGRGHVVWLIWYHVVKKKEGISPLLGL